MGLRGAKFSYSLFVALAAPAVVGACSSDGTAIPAGSRNSAAAVRSQPADTKVMAAAKFTFDNYMLFDEAHRMEVDEITGDADAASLALFSKPDNYRTNEGIINKKYVDSLETQRRDLLKTNQLAAKYKTTMKKYASNPEDARYTGAKSLFEKTTAQAQSLEIQRKKLLLQNAEDLTTYDCPKVRARAQSQRQALQQELGFLTGPNNNQSAVSQGADAFTKQVLPSPYSNAAQSSASPKVYQSPYSQQAKGSSEPIYQSPYAQQQQQVQQSPYRSSLGASKCAAAPGASDEDSCSFFSRKSNNPMGNFKTKLIGVREKVFSFFKPKNVSSRQTQEQSMNLTDAFDAKGNAVTYDLYVTSVPGVETDAVNRDKFTVCETEAVQGKESTQNSGCVTLLGTIGKPGKESGQVPIYDEPGLCNPLAFFVKSSDPAIRSNIEPESVTTVFTGSGASYALKLTLDFKDVKTGLTIPLGAQFNSKTPFRFYVKTTNGPVGNCQ